MPEFVNPFSGKIPERQLTSEELIRAIRLDLAAEHEAVHACMAHADATDNQSERGDGSAEKTPGLLKKFEQDHEIYVDAQDTQFYWVTNSRILKKQESHHRSRKYVSGPNEKGNVLIFPDHERSDAYVTENWGTLKTFDDFVQKALASILADKEESDQKLEEGCGTSCDY